VTHGRQEEALDELERLAFTYFSNEVDDRTGLVRDNTRPGVPASIAGSGFALACYAVGAERGYLRRDEAAARVRTTLDFLWRAPQTDGADATGWRGLYYHFLAMETGRRVWTSELSTVDSGIALAGALTAGMYFDRDTPVERDVRRLADALYRRADWRWATNGGRTLSQGWRPESGFLRCGWEGYTEALFLYILGLGSPTHALDVDSYAAWRESYRWVRVYGYDYLYAGPLFIHQLSHCWIDFRGIQDAYMRDRGLDYFENSRRATYVHRAYARRNPRRWRCYAADCWGVTASDGPGPATRVYAGERRRFYGYHARGVPFGIDDGTLSPWAMAASLPFAPEIVLQGLAAVDVAYPAARHGYGYFGSFNPSFPTASASGARPAPGAAADGGGWTSPAHYAINQGPIVLMVENYRSGLVWRLMRQCPYVVAGLRRAGFAGGWLDAAGSPSSMRERRRPDRR